MEGQSFGNYKTLSLLGRGGMGSVYLAENQQIGRKVAIKLLRDDLAKDGQVIQRFLNEARAANAIRHPNIIEILDGGIASDGRAYLVMELLEGMELSRRIRQLGRLPVRNALEICYQTASALAAAHEAGIIHRDLKPDNLFLVSDPVDKNLERVKVLDFGIAKLQAYVSGAVVKTQTGALLGTPVYMSPEQCLGTREITEATDIYALGCILFEMLAGSPPFMSEGVGELIHMHLSTPAPALRTLVPVVPEAVANLVARMLAKQPGERPRSMQQVQQELRLAAGGAVDLRVISSLNLAPSEVPPAPLLATAETQASTSTVPPAASTDSSHAVAATRKTSGKRWSLVGAVVVVALGGGALVLWSRPRTTATAERVAIPTGAATQSARTPPATVEIQIGSDPAGADVLDPVSRRVLGVTPFTLSAPSSQQTRTLLLEKDGFLPLETTVDVAKGGTASFRLRRLPAAVSAEEPHTTSKPATHSPRRTVQKRKPATLHTEPKREARPPATPEPAKL